MSLNLEFEAVSDPLVHTAWGVIEFVHYMSKDTMHAGGWATDALKLRPPDEFKLLVSFAIGLLGIIDSRE